MYANEPPCCTKRHKLDQTKNTRNIYVIGPLQDQGPRTSQSSQVRTSRSDHSRPTGPWSNTNTPHTVSPLQAGKLGSWRQRAGGATPPQRPLVEARGRRGGARPAYAAGCTLSPLRFLRERSRAARWGARSMTSWAPGRGRSASFICRPLMRVGKLEMCSRTSEMGAPGSPHLTPDRCLFWIMTSETTTW